MFKRIFLALSIILMTLSTTSMATVPDVCGECDDKITKLTLKYNGTEDAVITAYDKKSNQFFTSTVNAGRYFTLRGFDDKGTLGTSITIHINGVLDTDIHTSCSKPINIGMTFGSFTIVDGYSLSGGRLCPVIIPTPTPTPPPSVCGECDGGLTSLTLQYNGVASAQITVSGDKAGEFFSATVAPGGSYTLLQEGNKDSKLDKSISIYIDGVLNAEIHTSCSKPIAIGMAFGLFTVTDGYSLKGGQLCVTDEPDPTPDPDLCAECDGGLTSLTLQYNGAASALITVSGDKADKFFSATVAPGESFILVQKANKDGKLDKSISVYIDGKLDAEIHTSCSKPIAIGMTFGSFTIIDGFSLKGGHLCKIDPEPNPDICNICEGGLTELTLQYNGIANASIKVYNKALDDKKHHGKHHGKHHKKDKKDKKSRELFSATVVKGGEFTLHGTKKDGKLEKSIYIYIDGKLNTKIHTSCSQPIEIGMSFGAFKVTDGVSLKGGRLCTDDEPQVGDICGMVYYDKDHDDQRDPNEFGKAGIKIKILDSNGNIYIVNTDNQGFYCVRNVVEGSATITVLEETLPKYPVTGGSAQLGAGYNPNDITVVADTVNDAGKDGYEYLQ